MTQTALTDRASDGKQRLLRVIMTPAMIIAWVAGLWLAWQAGFYKQGWFHAKFLLVIMLSAAHG